jgi:hypothetical protein
MKRNNLIKVIISLLISSAILGSFSVPVFATGNIENSVSPRWTSIATMEVDIGFLGNIGNTSATARKQASADYIIGTLFLYKWNGSRYEYMDEVSGKKTVGTLGLSIDFVAEVGVQYKAVLTVVAYTDNVGECETITYYETCRGN